MTEPKLYIMHGEILLEQFYIYQNENYIEEDSDQSTATSNQEQRHDLLFSQGVEICPIAPCLYKQDEVKISYIKNCPKS